MGIHEADKRSDLLKHIREQDARIAVLEAEKKRHEDELVGYAHAFVEWVAERDRLRGLIDEHNNECVRRCGEGEQEGVRCGYRPYFPRRCPECPRHEMIEVAALEGE